MPEPTPGDFPRAVVDPLRLRASGPTGVGATSVAHISGRCGASEEGVRHAHGRLAGIGLVDAQGAVRWDVVRGVGERLATSARRTDLGGPPSLWSVGEVMILGQFFEGTRLVSILSTNTSRRVVLEYLAQRFKSGLRYLERDVNLQLQLAHAGYAALRRHLVAEGFMTRVAGVYQRTGGRYGAGGDVDE